MIWNYNIIAKQNKITLIIIFYNSISYSRLASPACGTPIEENYSAHTDTYISGFNLRDFRWNEKLRKMRYVPDIGEPKQPIPQKKVEMISEEANLICISFTWFQKRFEPIFQTQASCLSEGAIYVLSKDEITWKIFRVGRKQRWNLAAIEI